MTLDHSFETGLVHLRETRGKLRIAAAPAGQPVRAQQVRVARMSPGAFPPGEGKGGGGFGTGADAFGDKKPAESRATRTLVAEEYV